MNVRRALLVLISVLMVSATACGDGADQEQSGPASRGEVVSVAPISAMTGPQTGEYLDNWQYPVAQPHGTRALRIVYTTVDPDGAPTTASGLLAVPDTDTSRLRLVTYGHGTMLRRDEAPSEAGETDRARTLMFAAAGYATVAPDYLGMGSGPGPHPYAHAPSEGAASADLLQAARSLLTEQGYDLHSDILVTGFSQGAQAALELGRSLQTGAVEGFGVGAVAAISGPYAVEEVQAPAALDGRVGSRQAVLYLAYWTTAMNRIYHFYDDPAEAFRAPYAHNVEELFDGHHDVLRVSSGLPQTPQELLTPEYLELAAHPTGAIRRAMTDSDAVCDWTTSAPVRLYGAAGDRSVLFENSQRCMKAELGAAAELVDLGDIDHGATVRTALPRVLDWFRETAPPA